MIDILNLKQYQEIIINDQKYLVLNKVKFIEKSSYWYEYKLQKDSTKDIFHLNVELSKKAILYSKVSEDIQTDAISIMYKNKSYSLYENGTGKTEICYGMSDYGMHEEVKYYEYVCNTNSNEVISVEIWKSKKEISIGQVVKV